MKKTITTPKRIRSTGKEKQAHEWAFCGMTVKAQTYEFHFRCNCHDLLVTKIMTNEMLDMIVDKDTYYEKQ